MVTEDEESAAATTNIEAELAQSGVSMSISITKSIFIIKFISFQDFSERNVTAILTGAVQERVIIETVDLTSPPVTRSGNSSAKDKKKADVVKNIVALRKRK